MARRKHTKTKHTTTKRGRKRGRVGAISSDQKTLLTKTMGGIIGAVAGSYLGGVIKTQMDKSDTLKSYSGYAVAGVQIVGGLLLPKVIKQKSPLLEGVQMGLMINGGLTLVSSLGILPGVGGIEDYYVPMVGAPNQRSLEDARSMYVPAVGYAHAAAAGMMN
jgi:hypothetical protein